MSQAERDRDRNEAEPEEAESSAAAAAPESEGQGAEAPAEEPRAEAPDADVIQAGTVATDDPAEAFSALQADLEDTRARLKAVSAAYVRQQEEMAAFRERLERQAEERQEALRGDAVAALLEPLEQLRRCIEAVEADEEVSREHVVGLQMVLRAFLDGFRTLGLEEISGEGEPFNPAIHEAIGEVRVDQPEADGRVQKVFSLGYRVGSRLIRPARVLVGRYHAPEQA